MLEGLRLIVTCSLHGIDPGNYLVDVLRPISEHSVIRLAELTPRLWKQHFAANVAGFGGYFGFYNSEDPHTALDRSTPDNVYFESQSHAAAA